MPGEQPQDPSAPRAGVRAKGVLYHGDNLAVLRGCVADKSIALVYMDPPFNSGRDYEILGTGASASASAAGTNTHAFGDSWRWDGKAEAAYDLTLAAGGPLAAALASFRQLLGEGDTLAYLSSMAPRLVELRRVLAPTGSMYLHCDPTASHYLKILLDAVFGARSFRREIVWRSGWVSGFKSRARNWIRNHDVILYYVMDPECFTFNKDFAYRPHDPGYSRRGGGSNPKGVAIDDVWGEPLLYSPWIKSFSTEKLGYQTQKPLELLRRILLVSSNEGDLILDPFSGSGTTLHAAELLGRSCIAIDSSAPAINLGAKRLRETLGVEIEVLRGP